MNLKGTKYKLNKNNFSLPQKVSRYKSEIQIIKAKSLENQMKTNPPKEKDNFLFIRSLNAALIHEQMIHLHFGVPCFSAWARFEDDMMNVDRKSHLNETIMTTLFRKQQTDCRATKGSERRQGRPSYV